MWTNLLLGTALIFATVFIHTVGLVFLSRLMTWIVYWFQLHRHDVGKTVAIMTTVFGLFFPARHRDLALGHCVRLDEHREWI